MVCECVALCVSFLIHPCASSWCWDLWPAGKWGQADIAFIWLWTNSYRNGTPAIREVQISVKALHNYTTRDDSI